MDLHVCNVSAAITQNDLVVLFSLYGPVASVVMLRNKRDKSSTGCAFISMANDELASKAILHLDQTLIGGQRICVSELLFSLHHPN